MNHVKGRTTAGGVFLADDFRDHLIIDRYASTFDGMRREKLNHMRSRNSEDVMTWNVFRSLRQLDPAQWFPRLFAQTFGDLELPNWNGNVSIRLWDTIEPPFSLTWREGESEVDVIIEGHDFVWFIEAKNKSDISMSVSHHPTRNQIQRNIDVGSHYAGPKDFYFSLLVRDALHSPLAVATLQWYLQNPQILRDELAHRADGLENLCRVGLLTWGEMIAVLAAIAVEAPNETERGYAKQAVAWLSNWLT